MLVRRVHLFAIPALSLGVLAIANCTVKEVDDDGFGASGNVGNVGGDGTGNEGNEGGFGGDGTGGTGVGGGGNAGGTGGDCVGVEGSGTAAQCTDTTQLPLAAGANVCTAEGGTDGNLAPPGIKFCQKVYEVFNTGPADFFFDCIAQIGVEPTNSCDIDQVQGCFDDTVGKTCLEAESVAACDQLETDCATQLNDMTLTGPEAGLCEFLISPFNDVGYNQWAACTEQQLNEAGATCLEAVEGCWQTVTAIQL